MLLIKKLVTIRDFDLEYAVMMIDIDSFKECKRPVWSPGWR